MGQADGPRYTASFVDAKDRPMRLCPGYLLFVAMVVVLALMTLLGGCGQKGELYLPEDNPPAESSD
jgi:hypothetical protein